MYALDDVMQTMPMIKPESRPHVAQPPALLVRHARLQVVILTLGVLEAVLALLHVLALIPTKSLDGDVDQAIAAAAWVIARTLPPHGATQADMLDVVDLLACHLWRIVRDHGTRRWVVRPGRDGLRIVKHLGAWLGQGL